jgi:hypothetical protein
MRVALIDPFDHRLGHYGDVERVPSVAAVADALVRRKC